MSNPQSNMLCNKNFFYLVLILFSFACGETNYILREDTPPIDVGFYSFRWTTPMSIVEKEFPAISDAQPDSKLNTYNSSYFKGGIFLSERISSTEFTFNESGLMSISINIYANQNSFEDLLNLFREKLIATYGEPIEQFAMLEFMKIPDFLVKYSWSERRLQLLLKPDYSLEIKAFRFTPIIIIRN